MKFFPTIAIVFLFSFTLSPPHWQNNFVLAKKTAGTEHKYILLNFSGSDWCGPCIKMHKEILESDVFTKFADEHLVLVNADFPRQKKNQLPAEQQKQNDQLADRYNHEGAFPFTLLLAADGKVIKSWDGFPKQGADEFTNEVKIASNGGY